MPSAGAGNTRPERFVPFGVYVDGSDLKVSNRQKPVLRYHDFRELKFSSRTILLHMIPFDGF